MSDQGSNQPDPNNPDPTRPQQPGQPDWGPPQPGEPQQGQPQQGQPQYGQPQYGQPQYGQPQYGQPQYGQPQYGQPGQPQYGQPPQNYLVWAILSTVLCCLPLGVAAIVFAAQVNSKYAAGDLVGAQESSRKAKQFTIWSAVAGLVVGVIYVVFVVLVAAGSDS